MLKCKELYNCMKQNRMYGNMVAGQLLSLIDFFKYNFPIGGKHKDFSSVEKSYIMRFQQFESIFQSKVPNDILFKDEYTLPPTVLGSKHAPRQRFKSTKEREQQKRKHNAITSPFPPLAFTESQTNTGKKRKCTFCKDTNCTNVKSCPKKVRHGAVITNADEYCSYLKNTAPYRQMLNEERSRFMRNPDVKQMKHIQILAVVCKVQISPQYRPSDENFFD